MENQVTLCCILLLMTHVTIVKGTHVLDEAVPDEPEGTKFWGSFLASNVVRVYWTDGTSNHTPKDSNVYLALTTDNDTCQSTVNQTEAVPKTQKGHTWWGVSPQAVYFIICVTHTADNGTTESLEIFLHRKSCSSIPMIDIGPDYILEEGEKRYVFQKDVRPILPCALTEGVTARISWFYEGSLVKSTKNTYSSSYTADQDGLYHCEATNDRGTARSNDLTLIKVRLYTGSITSIEEDYINQVEGDTRILECPSVGSTPEDSTYWVWKKNYRTLRRNPKHLVTEDGELIFVEMALSDTGNYSCYTKNRYSSTGRITKVFHITVKPREAPLIERTTPTRLHPKLHTKQMYVLEGSTQTMHCVFQASDRRVWYYNINTLVVENDHVLLHDDNQTLEIRDITPASTGHYHCVASNQHEKSNGTKFDVHVRVLPVWREKPASQQVTEGQAVTYTCEVEGIPAPSTHWYYNGRPWKGSERTAQGSRITLSDVIMNMSGIFQCKAQNDEGTIWSNAALTVNRRLRFTHLPLPVTLGVHTSAILVCEVEADIRRRLAINWEKDGRPVDTLIIESGSIEPLSDNQLHLSGNTSEALRELAGKYSCVVTDGLSTITGDVMVEADIDPWTEGATHPDNMSDLMISFSKENWWLFVLAFIGLLIVLGLCAAVVSAVVRKRYKGGRLTRDGGSGASYARSCASSLLSNHEYAGDFDTDGMIYHKGLRQSVQDVYVPRSRVQLEGLVGKGQFARVFGGFLLDENFENPARVAVKTLRFKPEEEEIVELFLNEAITMKKFNHQHVLSLIGITFEFDSSPMVILPYMGRGDLKHYIQDPTLTTLTVLDLLEMGLQVARGMVYLATMHFVHRDLAARNCMVDDDGVVKVADFGLSRDTYQTDYYRLDDHRNPLPLRWMAPESLESGLFTTSSDMWSFGVLLWELMTRGETPYNDVTNHDITRYVTSGGRLRQPVFCNDSVYTLNCRCWEMDPILRPTFQDMTDKIEKIIQRARSGSMSSGSRHLYVNMKPGQGCRTMSVSSGSSTLSNPYCRQTTV